MLKCNLIQLIWSFGCGRDHSMTKTTDRPGHFIWPSYPILLTVASFWSYKLVICCQSSLALSQFYWSARKKEMLWSPPTGWGWLDSDLRGERRQPPAQPHLVEGGQHLRQLLRAQRLRHRDQHLDLPGAGERGPGHQVCVPGLKHKLYAPSVPGGSHKPQL